MVPQIRPQQIQDEEPDDDIEDEDYDEDYDDDDQQEEESIGQMRRLLNGFARIFTIPEDDEDDDETNARRSTENSRTVPRPDNIIC